MDSKQNGFSYIYHKIMIKICKIIHIGSYVVKMRRWKYNQNYGQCYKCVFNKKSLCT